MQSEEKSILESNKDDMDVDADETEDKIGELTIVPKSGLSKFSSSNNSNTQTNSSLNQSNIIARKLKDYSALDWKESFPNMKIINDQTAIYWKGDSGPNLVCLHGAGHSALSFAPLAKVNNKYRTISFDFRGHGNYINKDKSDMEDMSQATLIKDTIKVLEYIEQIFPEENIIVIGHSMGGAIAAKTVEEIVKNDEKYKSLAEKIQGLIIIDVVEGTAMEALPFMENIVKSRPSTFKDLDSAVEYMYKSGTIKNLDSARLSVPILVEPKEINSKTIYVWKTDLLLSQKYWAEWFTGLTKTFLSIKVPKILLLAGRERMDKALTIAQMQGKFKLCVLEDVGHIVQEDKPKETLNIIDDFIKTFKIPAKYKDVKPIVGKLGSQNPKIQKYEEYVEKF